MEFSSLPVVNPASVDETQQLLIVSPDSLTPQRVQIRGAAGLIFSQFDPANPNVLEDLASNPSIDLDTRELRDANDNTVLQYDATGLNLPGCANFPGGRILMPNLPTADPADGNAQLWMDPITRVVQVGT